MPEETAEKSPPSPPAAFSASRLPIHWAAVELIYPVARLVSGWRHLELQEDIYDFWDYDMFETILRLAVENGRVPVGVGTLSDEHNPHAAGLTGSPTGGASVGIVVPAYRVEAFVEATLRSIQFQTYQDWECIVVDDGSPDTTAQIVARVIADDPRIRLVRQENRGLAGARNTGITHLSPGVRYVTFLDSDDLWLPHMLEALCTALKADAAAVGAYGYAERIDENGIPIEAGRHREHQENRQRIAGWLLRRAGPLESVKFEELVFNSPVWPPAVALLRKDIVDRIGQFDTGLKQLEDYDFVLRMSRHGDFRPIGQQVAWYRQHSGQMTRRRGEFWLYHDTMRRKTWKSTLNTPAQRRVAARSWRVAQSRRIIGCAMRLVSAVLHRQWSDIWRFQKGLGVLLIQATRSGPPAAKLEHVLWTGRDLE